ncbi:hypothetical protein EZV62_011416 [Acer yangbiense]|uniref:TF-B3 domain-containing protein n=1 Tax=Acer yangbiense TaxID=1000413 RepID=A0A5C7I753_9ROSI|nr:hypothetical protein EZV62_011416 [Acer yangbiense]
MDVRTPNPAVCSLKKNRVCDKYGCPMSCGKMYECPSSQKNQANASSGYNRGIKRHPGCVASSSMSPKFKYDYGYESRGKKCKVEEPAKINESKAAKESRIYVARNFGVVSEIEREKVINFAKLFKSSENPSFMAIMQERNIQRCSLYVPAKFTNKYLERDFAYNIKLEDSDGKEWLVQIKGRSCCGGSDLTKGWCLFTKEKMLENGDILVFELIRKDNILLKVSVFQSTMV